MDKTAVCYVCGQVYIKAKGHDCPGPRRIARLRWITRTRAGRNAMAWAVLWCLTMAASWYVSVFVRVVLTGH